MVSTFAARTASDPITPTHDAVVIGGGIAGLVAARDLAVAGLRVCLVEAARAVGGRVRSTVLAGLPVELGAEAFATRGGAVEALLSELGLASEIVRPERDPAWVITAESAHPLPASGALGVPTRPLAACNVLGLGPALWAATEPWRPRRPHAPEASVAEVARARLGARATAALIAPVVEGVYSASPDSLRFNAQGELARAYARTGSLVRAAREVRDANLAAGGAVASLTGGLSRLTDRLVSELRRLGVAAYLGSAVTGLDPVPDRPTPAGDGAVEGAGVGAVGCASWRVRWAGGECLARAVVLAVPPKEVERLLNNQRDTPLSAWPETAVETVALVVDSPALGAGTGRDRRRGAGHGAPRGTGALIRHDHPRITAKALTHATAKWAWLRDAAPTGRHILRLSYGSRGAPPATAGLGDDAAARLALHDAAEILGVALDEAQLVAHTRARWTVPARAQPPALPAGARCTGEAYAGTGLASLVPHARRIARDAAEEINRSHQLNHSVQRDAPAKSKGLDT